MKQRRRRAEIEHWLEVRDREGLSIRETAERAGIPVGTLSWWTHKLREESRAVSGGFLEVVAELDDPEGDDMVGDTQEAPCVLRLPGGVVLEARGSMAELLIERLTEGLATCS